MPQIIEIADFYAPELDVYARLNENQLLNRAEPEKGLFIAESPKVVERAMNAGYEPVSMLVEKKHIDGEAKEVIARAGDIPIYTAEFEVLKQLTGFALTRGVLCAMRRKSLPKVEDVCQGARRIAILENVMNPTNVGAIFRSAAALNIDAVLLTPACSNPLYRRSARVSMGTVFQIPWTYFSGDDAAWPHPGIDVCAVRAVCAIFGLTHLATLTPFIRTPLIQLFGFRLTPCEIISVILWFIGTYVTRRPLHTQS